MQANTEEAQTIAVKKSFEKGVFPPKIEISFSTHKPEKGTLESLKKEFKKAKKAFKVSKENFEYLKTEGRSKKTLAKAKFAKALAKTKKVDLEAQIKTLEVLDN